VQSDAGSRTDPEGARRRTALALGLALVIAGTDQVTKSLVVANLSDRPLSIIGTTVELRLSRNTGGAFSLFREFTPLLAILAVLVALVLVRVLRRTDDRIVLIALALVLGGALGNLTDRMLRAPGFLRGAVVDFVRVGAWPSFNVADSAISIGAVLLVLWGWRRPDDPGEREPPT
jgi:signal peptidase II